ncbi:MAG TPA: HAMP domain-containing sensor histidine kinase [Polyangia bacterium]
MEIRSKALSRPAWQRYLTAVALTLAVVGARLALNPWWGLQQNRHLVLLPTVILTAWWCGFRPGVLSAALSTLALHALWSKEPGLLRLPSLDEVLFLGISLVVCAVVSSLQIARARADAATRSLERVLEIVAHDLRNPLTAIKTLAASVAHGNPTLAPRLDRIDRAVDRMDRLIGQLVESTRIGHGELTISPRAESVEWMVHEAVDSFSITAREREVTLEAVEIPSEVAVQADRDLVLQVLGNLVGNALKFTPAGGRVTVTARPRTDVIELAVADNGSGIKPHDLPHVFEQYWKSDNRGTGLGLFIAERVVQAHHGRIWAESSLGVGTTFFFTLPRVSREAARPVDAERHLALDDDGVTRAERA